jgi:signal transduction histidine kinase
MVVAEDKPDLTNNQALVAWIQQSAPYGVITLDDSFIVRSWNHWMEVHSGLKVEDVSGQELFKLFPSLSERNLGPRFERALGGESSVLSTALHGYLLPFPSPVPQNDFPHMRQTAHITPLFSDKAVSGIVIVIEDVTQRESQSEVLRWQHRRDEMLSWALGHLLKTEEPRGSIRQLFFKMAEHLELDTFLLYLNDSEDSLRLHTLGGVPEECEADVADCPFSFLAESDAAIVINSLQSRTEPKFSALKKLGVRFAIGLPLFANKRHLGVLCFASACRDLIIPEETELLRMIAQHLATAIDREDTNQELQKTKAQLSDYSQLLEKRVLERTTRLQETVSELETVSYTLAHDLKAPLRSITGYCHILLADFAAGLPPDGKRIVQRLLHNSQSMDSLIRDLLAFSHISQDEVVISSMEILPLLNDLLNLRIPAVRKAIEIKTPLHRVQAHKTLLQQVLSNLIDNAIKFVEPKTKPEITIYSEVVTHISPSTRLLPLVFSSVGSSPLNDVPASDPAVEKRVRLWVCDKGIGITPGMNQRIFGVFERGASGTKYEGNGMGLAIVARAIQRMAGTCGVESGNGKGSNFWIELPAG